MLNMTITCTSILQNPPERENGRQREERDRGWYIERDGEGREKEGDGAGSERERDIESVKAMEIRDRKSTRLNSSH